MRDPSSKSRTRNADTRQRFFYAEVEAGVYDETIEFVVPMYLPMHNVVVDLAGMFREDRGWTEPNVLDVGSGTGAEAIGILDRIGDAHLVALDLCAPMHVRMRARLGKVRARRVSPMTADISSDELTPDRLLAALPKHRRSARYQLVVSCFTLHHLTHAEKRSAIDKVYSALAPGGAFILGDLFSFQSALVADKALEYDLDWIRRNFAKAAQRRRVPAMRAKLKSLERRWLAHYVRDNLTEPIEAGPKPSDTSISRILQEAGFINVLTPFRFWQVGVVVAEKPLDKPNGSAKT